MFTTACHIIRDLGNQGLCNGKESSYNQRRFDVGSATKLMCGYLWLRVVHLYSHGKNCLNGLIFFVSYQKLITVLVALSI